MYIPTYPYAAYLEIRHSDTYNMDYPWLNWPAYDASGPSPTPQDYTAIVVENPWLRAVIVFAGLAALAAVLLRRPAGADSGPDPGTGFEPPVVVDPQEGELHKHHILADDEVCVWTMDFQSNRVVVDDEFLKITGYTRDEVANPGWRSWDLFHPDDVEDYLIKPRLW